MKKVKILTIILAIVLVTMIAFFGIYTPIQNRMENSVKGYSYAMDLKGARTIRLKVDNTNETIIKDQEGKEVTDAENLTDEELAEKGYTKEEVAKNAQESLTEENYKTSKKIIEERLKKLNVDNYTIRLDRQAGDIIVEIPENDLTDSIITNIGTTGKFEIVDTETQEVLMDNNDIKLANVMYGSNNTSATSTGTSVYLNIEFTKDGAKKLEDISNKYVKSEETENTDNTENATETENTADTENATETENTADTENATETENTTDTENTEKTITMKIDDEEIMTTSFDETMKTGVLQLSIGSSSTDVDTLNDYIAQANSMAIVLDTGKMPVQYEVSENQYILSEITNDELNMAMYIIIAVTAIALIVLIARYKTNGLLGAFAYVGLVSIFLILIRYANVVLSLEGIFGIVITLILNYLFINKLLSKYKKETVSDKLKETYKEFFIKIIPICIAVITFCFISWAPISSFGMVMFWGILLIAVYNFIITNQLLKTKASK